MIKNSLVLQEALIEFFRSGIKSEHKKMIGVEIEHFIVSSDTYEMLPYKGKRGVRQIVEELMRKYPEARPIIEEDLLGFSAPNFNITLEPAAQIEISIDPKETIASIEEIYLSFERNINSILKPMGARLLSVACQPVSKVRELSLIPKERYRLMDAHFEGTGTGGIEMMRGTCSTQVSIDFFSEEDFRKKIQAAYLLTPAIQLLCDNAAYFEGRALKGKLKRADIWNRTDPVRCGIPKDILWENYSFKDCAEYLCEMPLIFLPNDKKSLTNRKQSAKEIFAKEEPNREDILHIISMVFPDVRLKQYIEIRGADAMPCEYMLAYSALIKGLMYSEEALRYCAKMIQRQHLTQEDIKRSQESLMRNGWHGEIYKIPAKSFVSGMIEMAKQNLPEYEQTYIDSFREVVEHEGILKVKRKVETL